MSSRWALLSGCCLGCIGSIRAASLFLMHRQQVGLGSVHVWLSRDMRRGEAVAGPAVTLLLC